MMGLRPASSRPEAALALSRKKSAQSYITMLTLAALILFYSLSISAVSIGSVPDILDIASVLGGSDRLKIIDPGSDNTIDPSEIGAFLDGIVEGQLKDYHIPGAAVSVVKGSTVIYSKGYGYESIDKQKPVNPAKTLFRIGSVSNLFVWTSVMQQAEQGNLSLRSDVNSYLKDFQIPATYSEPVTLLNLMAHTAGFEDRALGVFVRNASDLKPLDQVLKDDMPARVRPPGEVTACSNYGASLAGYIVQERSGTPFQDYVQRRIFSPLGMNRSTFLQPLPSDLAKDMAVGYTYSGGSYIPETFEYVQLYPAGAASSTALDMAKFMIAHLQDGRYGKARILSQATAEQMHTQLFTNDPRVSGWDYGFMEMRLNGQRILWYCGDSIYFHTALVLLPEKGLGLFVTYNSLGGAKARMELIQAFLDRYSPDTEGRLNAANLSRNISKPPTSGLDGSYRPTRSSYTTYEKIESLISQIQVTAGANGTLKTSQSLFPSEKWQELDPLLYLKADITTPMDELAFRKDSQGNANYFFYLNDPRTAYQRVAWYDTLPFNLGILGACILHFLSVLIWPFKLIFGPSRFGWIGGERNRRNSYVARAARWTLGFNSLLNLVILAGLLSLSLDFSAFLYEVPPAFIVMLNLGMAAAVMSVGSAALAVLSWRRGYWGIVGRAHFALVTAACLAFTWWMINWNILGIK